MAAWRYEISLRVLKNIARVSCAHSCNIFQHERRNFVSPIGHVICSFIDVSTNEIQNHFTFRCERRNILCNHSNGDLFTCEDNMLFHRQPKLTMRVTCGTILRNVKMAVNIKDLYGNQAIDSRR